MRALLHVLPIPGALLGREMRGTSRRARFYVMRLAYVAMLALYVAAAWIAVAEYYASEGGSETIAMARMADAGKLIAIDITWFQFLSAQVAAAVLLSTSISGEIARGTLPLLLASPIPRRQIVVDKLLGGLLHVGVLLGISFPVLALIRVFGGVPWGFVFACTCVTLSAAAFIGALAVYFSARLRWPQATIVSAIGSAIVFYWALGPLLGLFARSLYGSVLPGASALFSPVMVMSELVDDLVRPRGAGGASAIWPVHCVAMYAVTLLILRGARGLLIPSRRREAIAARLKSRQNDLPELSLPVPARRLSANVRGRPRSGALADVTGSPILWKDLRRPWVLQRRHGVFAVCFGAALLGFLYLIMLGSDRMRSWQTHLMFVAIYLILICANTAVLAPSSIAYEKETRGWTVLLTTPLSDWHIVMAKLYGAWYRGRVLWLLLALHLGVSVLVGALSSLAILYLAVLCAAFFQLTAGVGMLMGALCRRGHWAIFLTFLVLVGLAAIVPGVAERYHGPVFRESGGPREPLAYLLLDPVGLIAETVRNAEYYERIRIGRERGGRNLRELATPVILLSALHMVGGAACVFEARRRLRRSA